jgi:hypothetical protein
VMGNIWLDLGNGTNVAQLRSTFLGKTVTYIGGNGRDSVTYLASAGSTAVRFSAELGAGYDSMSFSLNPPYGPPGVNPSYAFVDFGTGGGTLIGPIDFACRIINLP